jgi:hypothetical protein
MPGVACCRLSPTQTPIAAAAVLAAAVAAVHVAMKALCEPGVPAAD